MSESARTGPAPARRRRAVGIGLATVAVVVVAVVVAVVAWPRAACGCAIPPDDDAAITTAQDFAAAVADDDQDAARSMLADDASLPDAERSATLSRLAQPGTTWFVAGVHRPDEAGTGDTPAQRVIAGLAADGTWGALIVRTDDDYEPGRVVPDVPVEGPPEVVRGGDAPLFAGDNEYTTPTGSFTLIAHGREVEPVQAVDNSPLWAYIGPGLAPNGRYLMVQTVYSVITDPEGWIVHAGWYEPTGA